MNDARIPSKHAVRLIRPRWFFAGLLGGLIALGWLGRQATKTDFHPDSMEAILGLKV